MRWLVLFALLAVGLAASTTAHAADDERAATQLYEESRTLYRDGKFAEAAALLEKAYALHPFPELLYNLARAREGLGDRKGAADAYERYLAADPRVDDRKSIEARIATLRRETESPPGPIAPTAPARPAPTAPPASASAPEGGREDGLLQGPFPWILTGVGAAIATAGAILFGVSYQVVADADAELVQIRALDGRDDAETLHTAGLVTLGAGGLTAAIGLSLGIAGSF